MLLQAETAQLVLLDWQAAHLAALTDAPAVLARARALQELARLFAVPTCSAQLPPELAGAWQPELALDQSRHIERSRYSAACEVADSLLPLVEAAARPALKGNARSLPKHLQKAQAEPRSDLLLAGCYTHTAVLQTALDLLDNEDYSLIIVADCCASPRQRDHDAALDRLAAQGAELVTLEMLALEWLADTEHRHAQAVAALLAHLP
jgi:nicotinamidase-related amidase